MMQEVRQSLWQASSKSQHSRGHSTTRHASLQFLQRNRVRGRVRLSKIGNARLRKALYFPAITALRCSEFFRAWAKGLRERGKCKMSVIGAAMRKLIHLAYGVLKTGMPFDPEWAQKAKTA